MKHRWAALLLALVFLPLSAALAQDADMDAAVDAAFARAQAVGGAVGRNPIAILIPCHRVLGADGSLTGYAGGLAAKRFLLAHEDALGKNRD